MEGSKDYLLSLSWSDGLECKSDQGPAPRITNPKSLLSSFCLSNCDEDVWVLLFLLPKVEEWFILSMTSWLCSAPHLRQDRWRKLEGLSAREWKILLFLSKGNSILQQQCTKEIKRLAFMLIRINTEIGFVRFQLFLFKAFFYKHFEFWIFNSFTLNIRSKYHTFIVLQILTSPQKSNLRWSYDDKLMLWWQRVIFTTLISPSSPSPQFHLPLGSDQVSWKSIMLGFLSLCFFLQNVLHTYQQLNFNKKWPTLLILMHLLCFTMSKRRLRLHTFSV